MGKKWRKEEDDFLKENYEKLSNPIISNKLNRSVDAVQQRASSLGLKKPEIWSERDKKYLEKKYLNLTIKELAKNLNKSEYSVQRKLSSLGLNKYSDAVYIKTLATCFNSDARVVTRWIDKFGLPYIERANGRKEIDVSIFWKWAKEYITLLPLYKYSDKSLMPEPAWLEEEKKKQLEKRKTRQRISDFEKAYVISARHRGRYFSEIAKDLSRTKNSVKWIYENNMSKNK